MSDARGLNRERWSYDVFLSFRGEDSKKHFVGFLYKSLVRSGIFTFVDSELERGENIGSNLLKAIGNSKIFLVVLSHDYASSRWCLDELVGIMECHRSNSGHVVIPIFYHVDPSNVRRQRGSFGEPFKIFESRYAMSTLQGWKEALVQVGNLSGVVINQHRSEVEVIDNLTRDILKMLSISYKHLPTYAVGIKSRVHRIYELMSFGSDDVKIIGICGMGGIGKTTLAKASYNEFSDRFEGTSFLENFGAYLKKPEGKVHLQKQLLSDILMRDDILFNNMDHAVQQRFENKRVLVVIDDLEDTKQLNTVAIDLKSCFGPGSRIIITSRDKHLLEQLGIVDIFSPKELEDNESLELVSRHAFRTSEPPEAFLQLSKKLVEYCGGLPLAMEVLGASLFKRSISEWESTLELLKRNPDDNIQAKLRISFDGLKPVQKDIFLDIACYFIEMDKDYVGCILDACNFCPDIGLNVLMERCLITVRDNKLMMHDLLRDMGRNIVQEKAPNCGKRSRLWDPDDVLDVLTKHSGTDAIEGLSLKAETTDPIDVEAKALANMQELRLLQLSHVQVKGSYAYLPKGLRWLCWLGYPLNSVPTNLHLGSLVVMEMQYSNLKQLWGAQECKRLKKLKHLNLSHSTELTETPDFSYFPNLEKLLLINCKSLVLVHKSIGTLHNKLLLLNLKGCSELVDLPVELYKVKSLETLILSGCSKLEKLDDALGELESLTTFKADSTDIRQIPSSSNQLKKLEELTLDGCKGLFKDYPHSGDSPRVALSLTLSLDGLSCLKTLCLGSCNLSDELVPENLGSLSCLEELDLRGNNFRNLQIDFTALLDLQIIRLDNCSELQSMLSLPENLRSLYASSCSMLERTPDLSKCTVLQSLHLTNCFSLVETPGLDKLETVGVIHMEMCSHISDTYKERIMQGWAVGANGGIFIPGSSLPSWASFKNESESISFTVPETLKNKPVGFTLWTLYMSQQNDVMSEYFPKITVKNQTRGTVWSRKPATDHIRMYHKKHMWQGHYSNEDFILETGDHMEVSVDFGDQFTILETGITLAYRKEDASVIGHDEVEVSVDLADQVTIIESRLTGEENFESSDSDTSEIGHDEADLDTGLTREEDTDLSVSDNTSETGHDEISDEQLIQTEDGVDDELVMEESQSRPRRKMGMLSKTLVGAFGLLVFVVIVGKHGGLLRCHNRRRNIVANDKDKDGES